MASKARDKGDSDNTVRASARSVKQAGQMDNYNLAARAEQPDLLTQAELEVRQNEIEATRRADGPSKEQVEHAVAGATALAETSHQDVRETDCKEPPDDA